MGEEKIDTDDATRDHRDFASFLRNFDPLLPMSEVHQRGASGVHVYTFSCIGRPISSIRSRILQNTTLTILPSQPPKTNSTLGKKSCRKRLLSQPMWERRAKLPTHSPSYGPGVAPYMRSARPFHPLPPLTSSGTPELATTTTSGLWAAHPLRRCSMTLRTRLACS